MELRFKMDVDFVSQLSYVAILPVFFLVSALVYNPFDIQGYYTFGEMSVGFHLVMLSCIILFIALVSRILLHFQLKRMEATWWQYGLWCMMEVFIMSAFIALYSLLFKKPEGGFFIVLATCLKFVVLTLCYPYMFLIFVRIIRLKDEALRNKTEGNDNSLVRFYDEHKRLKLSIAPSSILYVNSDFNYVQIHYLDGDKVKVFQLRASMKSLESSISNKFLVRCQRSYFVNPEHVAVLRKNTDGFIFAEMNVPGLQSVPVSKQYYDSLSALL